MSGAACPCGSGREYTACCGPWHAGAAAPTAEALMRSRYTAFVMRLEPYLLATWHPSTRPPAVGFEAQLRWLGLKVESTATTGPDTAEVEFVARYKVGGASAMRMRERSRFVREQGRWTYVDAAS